MGREDSNGCWRITATVFVHVFRFVLVPVATLYAVFCAVIAALLVVKVGSFLGTGSFSITTPVSENTPILATLAVSWLELGAAAALVAMLGGLAWLYTKFCQYRGGPPGALSPLDISAAKSPASDRAAAAVPDNDFDFGAPASPLGEEL
jgi:hypothetical protein